MQRDDTEQLTLSGLKQSIQSVRDHSEKFEHNWVGLAINKRIDVDPNPPTTHAIRIFKAAQENGPKIEKPFVYDLGCGCGLDTRPYLEAGYQVTAMDAFAEIIENVNGKFAIQYPDTFTAECTTLQHTTFNQQADIVSCVTTFPWIPRADFKAVWEKVVGAVKPDGYFSFDLYGNAHSWANENESFFNKEQVFSLIEHSGLTVCWQEYYNTATGLVLSADKPNFEYWEFVCQKTGKMNLDTVDLEAKQASHSWFGCKLM